MSKKQTNPSEEVAECEFYILGTTPLVLKRMPPMLGLYFPKNGRVISPFSEEYKLIFTKGK